MDGCVGCVGWGEGNRSRKSTSPCDILLPLLSADWCPKLLRHLTSNAHTSLLKNLANGRVWTTRGRQLATPRDNGGVAPRHHARRVRLTEEYASLQLSPHSYAPVDNLLLFATTTGVRHVFTRVRLGTHPCSRTRRLDVLDVLDGAKATWVGRVRPFAIFFSLFCLQISTRPAHTPAQEFGRWTTPFSRDSIARLKSTPLCDIPFLPSPARVNLLLFATTMPAPCHRTRPAHDAIPAQEFRLQADPPSLGTQMARLSLWLHKSRSLESSNLHHWSRLSLSSPSHPRELLSR